MRPQTMASFFSRALGNLREGPERHRGPRGRPLRVLALISQMRLCKVELADLLGFTVTSSWDLGLALWHLLEPLSGPGLRAGMGGNKVQPQRPVL